MYQRDWVTETSDAINEWSKNATFTNSSTGSFPTDGWDTTTTEPWQQIIETANCWNPSTTSWISYPSYQDTKSLELRAWLQGYLAARPQLTKKDVRKIQEHLEDFA